jgi:hypothetical protein
MNACRQSTSIFKYFDNISLQEHQEMKQEKVLELKHIDESFITAGFMLLPLLCYQSLSHQNHFCTRLSHIVHHFTLHCHMGRCTPPFLIDVFRDLSLSTEANICKVANCYFLCRYAWTFFHYVQLLFLFSLWCHFHYIQVDVWEGLISFPSHSLSFPFPVNYFFSSWFLPIPRQTFLFRVTS